MQILFCIDGPMKGEIVVIDDGFDTFDYAHYEDSEIVTYYRKKFSSITFKEMREFLSVSQEVPTAEATDYALGHWFNGRVVK